MVGSKCFSKVAVKLNFDASIKDNAYCIGMVARDFKGRVFKAVISKYPFDLVMVAKIYVIYEVVLFAIEEGWKSIVM